MATALLIATALAVWAVGHDRYAMLVHGDKIRLWVLDKHSGRVRICRPDESVAISVIQPICSPWNYQRGAD